MLNFSPEKLLLVGVIALVVLGPNRLPQAARSLGRLMAQLRRMSSSFQDEVRGALAEPLEAYHSTVGDFRPPDVRRSVRDAITTTLAPLSSGLEASGPHASSPQASSQQASSQQASNPHAGGSDISVPPAPDDPSLN